MNSVSNLLPTVKKDFPDLKFVAGEDFHWSPKDHIIYYASHQKVANHGVWALLHEIAHAQLDHQSYSNDFDLIKIENKAWQQAAKLANKYGITINKEHIQDCLDTYRDWLHSRAKCPNCHVVSVQRDDKLYQCFNCKTVWRVPTSPTSKINKTVIKNSAT